MSLRLNTLSARLFLLTSIFALIGVLFVALVISSDYRNNAELRFNEILAANAYNLMGNIEVSESGELSGSPDLGDSRYSLFDSGWYWSVEKIITPDLRMSSLSLADQKIVIPEDVRLDETFQRRFTFTDHTGVELLGLEAQVILGEGNSLYSFKITAGRQSLDQDIARFRNRLTIILLGFALAIVCATYFLVRIGLRPLQDAREKLGAVRSGESPGIEGKFPDEISPLIDETNALIKSNNTIVERARTQVGNLAHSLKTPLAVLNNEMKEIPEKNRELFAGQLKLMQQQVQVYLDRARISARSSTSLAKTEAAPVIAKLVNVVIRLNPDIRVDFQVPETGDIIFEGEEHDLQEIIGNLLENAAKFAKSEVRVGFAQSQDNASAIEFYVEDDGPGMSDEQIDKAKKRGGRVDEGGTGWGLGMSIVRDVVDEYDGRFLLSRSDLGGLKAIIELPGRVEGTG